MFGVGTMFGKVKPNTYSEGMHFVNPFSKNHPFFDARQKTHKESMGVSQQGSVNYPL